MVSRRDDEWVWDWDPTPICNQLDELQGLGNRLGRPEESRAMNLTQACSYHRMHVAPRTEQRYDHNRQN
jgi:hypothetical protein